MKTRTYFHAPLLLLQFLILLLISSPLTANSIAWIGGAGDWNDPSKWTTGTIPQEDDEVSILTPGSSVTISSGDHGMALWVSIGSEAEFLMESNSSLSIAEASGHAGFTNDGIATIEGRIKIVELTIGSNSIFGGKGIVNRGNLEVGTKGSIDVYEVEGAGIWNFGSFRNYGTIGLQKIDEDGIINEGNFYNYDNLLMSIINTDMFSGIVNRGGFINYGKGDLIIQGGYHGLDNQADAIYYNLGELLLFYSESASVYNDGRLYNFNGAEMTIKHCDSNGIFNNDLIFNWGNIFISNVDWAGIWNNGQFYNIDQLQINETAYVGLRNSSGATYYNYGDMSLYNNAQLSNVSTFTNYNTGKIEVDESIFTNTGPMTNYGFITTTEPRTYVATIDGALFNNHGVVESVNGQGMSFLAINSQLYFGSITGTLQDGVPHNNTFDVQGFDHVEITNVYSNSNGTVVAGSYDISTNVFTPNANAIGLSVLYFETLIDDAYEKICAVPLDQPVQAQATHDPNIQTWQSGRRDNQAIEIGLTVFPNPTIGDLQITSSLLDQGPLQIKILNSLGQEVYQKDFEQFTQPGIQLPAHLPAGWYFLQAKQDGELMASEKIKLIR